MKTISNTIFIRSGGQTGVDQGVLEAACQYKEKYKQNEILNVEIAGWCPKSRATELGKCTIDEKYLLTETDSEDFCVRTRWNVRDSDATLILSRLSFEQTQDGTGLTSEEARRLSKPCLIIYLDNEPQENITQVINWIKNEIRRSVKSLNIGGPRESNCPGIYEESYKFMTLLLEVVRQLKQSENRQEQSAVTVIIQQV